MRRVVHTFVAAACAVAVGQATAQTYEQGGARITFQVFNPATSAWSSDIDCAPGQSIEWRAVLSYTGTRTDLFALGEAMYQPTFSNCDTEGDGTNIDRFGSWRNGGVSGNTIAGSMLTEAEGMNGGSLDSYGRVRFGATATGGTSSNTITTFSHTNGGTGAPAGNWFRVAGESVAQWPRNLAGPVPPLDVTQGDIGNITRGISSKQFSRAQSPAFHVAGIVGIVVFRGSITLSEDFFYRRTQISAPRESMLRVGGATGATEADDRRYIAWQVNFEDNGSHRTVDPSVVPASIWVIPAPGLYPLAAMCAMLVGRRRRA